MHGRLPRVPNLMARLGMAEMDHVDAVVFSRLNCQYCANGFGKTGRQTLVDIVQAVTEHKTACPNWPSPRVRTAQCRPMSGQTAIPLPE